MDLQQKIEFYVKIRDAKAAAKAAFTKETERMTLALTKLEGEILKGLDEGKVESVRTEAGTAYKKMRSTCTVKDRDEFYNWAVANDLLGAIDMKANAKAVRELLDAGTDVPGIKYSELIQVGIRRT